MNYSNAPASSWHPRICMPTFGKFARNAFRTGILEAQDVLASCDDVELIQLNPAEGFRFREGMLIRLMYHDPSGRISLVNPGLHPYRLRRDYDLFIIVCPYWRDVLYANAIKGWRERCRTTVCWIDEVWAKDIASLGHCSRVLKKFDHVIFGIGGSGKALEDLLGRGCHEMPGGVDAMRFSPYPDPPTRVVEVLSIGRRLEGIHQSLVNFSERNNMLYVYDTVQAGNSQVTEHREHRSMYANLAKRSVFFMVAPGKVNSPGETGGQEALGYRYFEGAAAGAVLIGQRPDCDAFYRNFDWPDAVIQIERDGSDAVEVISELLRERDRVQQISLRNVRECLLRHDWVYRWRDILSIAGLTPSPRMVARERRLQELAEMVGERLGSSEGEHE